MAAKPTAQTEALYDPDRSQAAPAATTSRRSSRKNVETTSVLEETAPPRKAAIEIDRGSEGPTADAALVPGATDAEILAKDIERIRKMRKPFGAMTQKLALPERPGYHRHWFNDEPGRIDEATSNGWAHVKDREGKSIRRVVGRGRDSGAMYGYAMELPIVFWQADQKARNDAAQARIDEIKKTPFRSKPGQGERADEGKFYSAKVDGVVDVRQPGSR